MDEWERRLAAFDRAVKLNGQMASSDRLKRMIEEAEQIDTFLVKHTEVVYRIEGAEGV